MDTAASGPPRAHETDPRPEAAPGHHPTHHPVADGGVQHVYAIYSYTESTVRKCDRCSYEGTPDTFPLKKNGSGYLKVCFACNNKQLAKKAASASTSTASASAVASTSSVSHHVIATAPLQISRHNGDGPSRNSAMELEQCLQTIASNKDWPFKFDSFVRLTQEEMEGLWQGGADASVHARANAIRDRVALASGYHWNQKKSLRGKGSSRTTVITYYCSQLEGENTKHKLVADEGRRRARRDKMPRYHCGGWLHVTIVDDDPLFVRVRLAHDEAHPPPDLEGRKRAPAPRRSSQLVHDDHDLDHAQDPGQGQGQREPVAPEIGPDGTVDASYLLERLAASAAESLGADAPQPQPPPPSTATPLQLPAIRPRPPAPAPASQHQHQQDVSPYADVAYALPEGFGPPSPPFSPSSLGADTAPFFQPQAQVPGTSQPHQHQHQQQQHAYTGANGTAPGPGPMQEYIDPALRNAPIPPHSVIYPPAVVESARRAFGAILDAIADPRGLDAELAHKLHPILGASVELAGALLAQGRGQQRDPGSSGSSGEGQARAAKRARLR
ncbi:hypothetical protein PUNSTDRAFT_145287 [Punctularia strigosozonata HHB-11173 SS5]|uniref:uncharacterized protein n=1 Tax=Punctularia strigosozonata (strain HHB-11173) TaxID=741275 RepID=UPI0004417A9C|nr:uncharacterized protein PUNSTDRAFT_145287 [Punctularia strigosozonata HHB-11173 SS5]EIN06808.1 hypothetical protein PUNSTDRAFT_145287 [Punctularia strigosozonata HHB-11173 SS5]